MAIRVGWAEPPSGLPGPSGEAPSWRSPAGTWDLVRVLGILVGLCSEPALSLASQGTMGPLLSFLIRIVGIVTPTLSKWDDESVGHPGQSQAV